MSAVACLWLWTTLAVVAAGTTEEGAEGRVLYDGAQLLRINTPTPELLDKIAELEDQQGKGDCWRLCLLFFKRAK